MLYAVVFFVLINFLYIRVISRTDTDFKKRLESLEFSDPDFDLLVLGASTTMDGIDTKFLTSMGIPSYNFAIGGATIRTNLIQLKEYLERCSEKPRYVVLGVNTAMVQDFDDDGINPIVEVTMKDHKFCLQDAPILKFKWLGFEFLKPYVSKAHRASEVLYGQFRTQKTVYDMTEYTEQDLDIERFENSYWIGELIKFCEQEDLNLIIIELPGFRATQNQTKAGLHEIRHKNGYPGLLLNYNARDFCEIFDPKKDWLGNSHLNVFGAEKFTRVIHRFITSYYPEQDSLMQAPPAL